MPICSLYSLFIYKVFLIPAFTNIQAGVAPPQKKHKKEWIRYSNFLYHKILLLTILQWRHSGYILKYPVEGSFRAKTTLFRQSLQRIFRKILLTQTILNLIDTIYIDEIRKVHIHVIIE